jgi:hypothetical protein
MALTDCRPHCHPSGVCRGRACVSRQGGSSSAALGGLCRKHRLDRREARLPRFDRSQALRRQGVTARMGWPAVVVPGQVYSRLTVLGELPEQTRGGRVFRCRCASGSARPTRGRSDCDKERSAPAAAGTARQGQAATPGRESARRTTLCVTIASAARGDDHQRQRVSARPPAGDHRRLRSARRTRQRAGCVDADLISSPAWSR